MDSSYFSIEYNPQLFLDNWLIECTQGLTRRWHNPVRLEREPLIQRDQPWEHTPYFTFSNHCVIKDPVDGLIKCWYEDFGSVADFVKGNSWKTRLLYAESTDGIHFRKPELDICSVNGRRTNIVMGYADGQQPSEVNSWADCGVHSNGIVMDPFTQNPDERFRTMFQRLTFNEEKNKRNKGRQPESVKKPDEVTTFGISNQTGCAHSADGLHWKPYASQPILGSSGSLTGDVSCLHYDPESRQFVMNTRHKMMCGAALPSGTPFVTDWFNPYYPHRPDLMNKRLVHQTRSHDFLHWADLVPVSVPDDEIDNLDEAHYGMQQFRVGRLQLATLGILRFVENEMDVRLLFSRDGINFRATNRGRPFLAPRGEGYWDRHMVSICSQPVEMGDEWWFYHGGTNSHHDWWIGSNFPENIDEPEVRDPDRNVRFGLGVARLRKEGIASLDGSRQRDGYIVTRPVMSDGKRLVINARCRKGGSIRVAVLDLDNRPMGNCSLDASDPFTGDSTCHTVTWGGEPGIPAGPEQWRKMHFLLRDAEFFSFRLSPGPGDSTVSRG